MPETRTRKIGRYEVLRRLGRGSQGSVFLGKDPNLERRVAIKVLTQDDGLRVMADKDRTSLEGRITGMLKHPNVISIYDAGNFGGRPYLVFEYVPGQTLYELLQTGGSLSVENACQMIGPLVDAIAMAHAEGITHLDLSPRNIMVDRDGIPRIMDFGLSQFTNRIPSREGYAVGTLRYMSPEHMSAKPLGPYTDVFALASTFFEMVTGQPALNGKTTHDIMLKLRDEPVDLQSIHELPNGKAFGRFLKGAFENDYRARYCDGTALQSAFERFLKDSGLHKATVVSETDRHSTVEFLLRRMRRKQDFPTMSRTLLDINRLTDKNSKASADKLANVILRDYALTGKLLKLVNSAYYSGIGGEVTSISHAIVILGLDQLRMIATGLTYIGQMKGAGRELKDSITKSLLSGLMARHLAQRAGLPDAEEAFICGLFQNLGENLVIYYFPEEYAEICELRDSAATDIHSASAAILGIDFNELGAAVAGTWKLPESIVQCMLETAGDDGDDTARGTTSLGHVAIFANDLCRIAQNGAAGNRETALRCLIERFGDRLQVSEEFALKLLAAGMQKLTEHARIFEIDVNRSGYCDAVTNWIDSQVTLQAEA